MDQPLISKKQRFSPIWILPLTALCIGGWLLLVTIRDAGFNITIHFDSAEGITAGKTVVMYKGIPVGTVYDMKVDDDLQGVTLQINMKKRCSKALSEDTKFWIVKPEVSAGRVRGLDTILTGSYIRMQLGTSPRPAKYFNGLTEAPGLPSEYPGLRITLLADELNSLQKGSHVYLKDIKIGQLEDYTLTPENQVAITVHIDEKYQHLIKQGTRFWNVSGFSVDADIQRGVGLKIESLAALMYGGIACATPPPHENGKPVSDGATFALHADYESASFTIPMTLELKEGTGIVAGKTKVMYQGLQLGSVKALRPTSPDNYRSVIAEIGLDPRARSILKKGTIFYLARPLVSLDGVKNLDTMISGPYISLLPGTGQFCDHFVISEEETGQPDGLQTKSYFLTSAKGHGLAPGAPILYKDIEVGKIKNSSLSPDGTRVVTEILIREPYSHLITLDSIFWRQSGARMDADLSGVTLDIRSLKGLVSGAISFTTPGDTGKLPAEEKTEFVLFDDFAGALLEHPQLRPACRPFHLRCKKQVALSPSSPILYNSLPIGEIVSIIPELQSHGTSVDICLKEEYLSMVNDSSRFYLQPGLSMSASFKGVEFEIESLQALMNGSIGVMTPSTEQALSTNKEFTLHADRFEAESEDDFKLTLFAEKIDNISPGMEIKYRGLTIGKIIKADFGPGLRHVEARAVVRGDAGQLFRETTTIRLIKPSLGLTGIENPAALIAGPWLKILPGKGEIKDQFTITETTTLHHEQGLYLTLVAPRLAHLRPSSPVYYRQVQIGEVTDYHLASNGQSVLIELHIGQEYAQIIHSGSKFWLTSGIQITGGLFSEFQVSAESVESLLKGGVGVATPNNRDMGRSAKNGDTFSLHQEVNPKWLNWSPELPIRPVNTPSPNSNQPGE